MQTAGLVTKSQGRFQHINWQGNSGDVVKKSVANWFDNCTGPGFIPVSTSSPPCQGMEIARYEGSALWETIADSLTSSSPQPNKEHEGAPNTIHKRCECAS